MQDVSAMKTFVNSGFHGRNVLHQLLLILLRTYYMTYEKKLTIALWYTPTPRSISLAGYSSWSISFVASVTVVGQYRLVGCPGPTAAAICRSSARITTVDSWK